MPLRPQVIVLNGGSSSGKTAVAHALQGALLPTPWLRLGVDALLDALPAAAPGIDFGEHGEVMPGEGFRAMEAAWLAGIAAMARAGARIIFEDVFLGGAASQDRIRRHLGGLDILWVGVRCDVAAAAARERARKDRVIGMASSQAETVHAGVVYDVEVDTSHAAPEACARVIAALAAD
jgi:chloramphenicol 3-O phosphotransferase